MTKKQFDPFGENSILVYFSLFKFLLLIFFAGNYGLFRDEFYYIECSKHLSFGYVDQPPLSLLILAISRTLFGESILGIRIFAYIAGSVTVFISGLIARELGGKKYAQNLTAICVIFSGVLLGGSSYFSMNAFDIMLSVLMFYSLIICIKRDDPKLWIVVGILFGVGLQNKLSFIFLGFGLAVALLFTRQRKYFLKKELYVGALIAFLIFLPHLIWQLITGFPTLEFMRNAASRKNVSLGLVQFFGGFLMELNPFYFPLLITSAYFLIFNKEGKQFLILAWIYIVVFTVFVLNNGKPYYMGVLFPMIIAAGAVGAEKLIEIIFDNSVLKRTMVRTALVLFLIPSFIIVTPFAIPILKVDSFVKFSENLGIKPASGERSRLGVLPQFYSDRFGWKEMTQKVAEVYSSLSVEEKKNVVIFAQNYGEAGAIDYYGKQYGMPPIYSPHNSYWMWGPPQDWNGSIAIIIGSNKEDNGEFFEEIESVAFHQNKFGMPYENVEIFLCRKIKMPMSEVWKRIKVFI